MSDEVTLPDAAVPVSLPAPPRRRRRRRFLIWLVVVLAFVGLFWRVLGRNETAPRHVTPGAVTVVGATARQGDMRVVLDAIGTVTPVYTTSITSQVTGQVKAVHYTEGQRVRVGSPLVDIDPRPFQAALLQAEGILERDIHVLAQARMDLERFRAAWARNAIARQQVEDQEKLVLQTEGTLKNDRGTVQAARVQLTFCHITSPITGRVGLRLIDPGNVVTATGGTTLAVVTQLQPITAVFSISEDNLGDVWGQENHGRQLPVELLDRVKSKTLATGKLITIDNQIDTTTGTVRLRALFANADEALYPNQFVNARLLVRTLQGVTMLPSSAIQHRGTASYVYVVRDDVVHGQDVKVGVIDGEMTQVDLAPGTVVANSSFEKLQDGSRVVVTAAPPATGSAAPSLRSSLR